MYTYYIYILYITYNIIQHVWALWWITQRLEKIRRVYFSVLCTIYFSEMEFIIFHLQGSTLLFSCYTVANLIGLLHLLLHDDSNSCKHNMTLLYSTHIWTHLLPSLVLSLEFHGVAVLFFFSLQLSYLNTEHATLRCLLVMITLQPMKMFSLSCFRNRQCWVATPLPMTNRVLLTCHEMGKNITTENCFSAEGSTFSSTQLIIVFFLKPCL